ncbi:Proline iminopeptidase OS=Streptomyces fumanus OX=67302 GN=GCM10018772_65910 PE=3 SV=1 [Streptomyces fumanus]
MASAPPRSIPRYEDPVFRMGFARTVTHYWGNDHFLGDGNDEGVVLRDAPLLAGLPGTLVQGVLDPGNLLGTVWRLHHAWPASELLLVDDVGHNAGAPGMAELLRAATDRYAADGR